jgi:hypothetical protein
MENKETKKSQEFMLLFRMEPSNEQPTPEQLQEMETQWGGFIGGIASQGILVSTHHLGFTGKKITASHTTEDGFHVAEGNMIAGNMVLKADSIETATELAKKCPILYAGGSVEVRDVMVM